MRISKFRLKDEQKRRQKMPRYCPTFGLPPSPGFGPHGPRFVFVNVNRRESGFNLPRTSFTTEMILSGKQFDGAHHAQWMIGLDQIDAPSDCLRIILHAFVPPERVGKNLNSVGVAARNQIARKNLPMRVERIWL